ncbi:MAG: DUF6588 family protein [Syntrophothermus sp.]
MQKITTMLFLALFLLAKPGYSQFQDRFSYLNDQEIPNYVKPFATSLGVAFNSASYHDADIADIFGFSFSIHGMYIMIPDDQLTFSPDLPNGYSSDKQTATIFGNKGGAYSGPDGFKVYPPGLNQTSLPAGVPQVTFSLVGTELLVRYFPSLSVGDEKLSMLGLGLSHEISRYIPLLPVSVAAQVLYNNFEITNLVSVKNLAFNLHASKTFGLFVAYTGLQYENTTLDVTYTYEGTDRNSTLDDKEMSVSIDGDNSFRFTLGGALKLGFFHLNADVNLGAQTVFTTGLTFAF